MEGADDNIPPGQDPPRPVVEEALDDVLDLELQLRGQPGEVDARHAGERESGEERVPVSGAGAGGGRR